MIYWRKILIQSLMCGFLSTIALTFLSCDSKEKNAQDKAQIPVNMQKITTKNVELDFEYPARLKSLQSVNVYARVEGVLLAQEFKEGEIVQEGQKLFKIDPTRYQARVNVAKAQYSSAKANLTKATKDWNRVEKLYKQGVLTVDQYDQSLYDYQSALANVENTKASLDDALIDLNLQLGDVSTFLNLNPAFDVNYVIHKLVDKDETTLLKAFEKYKNTSMYVLADPSYIEQSESITPQQITTLFNALKKVFPYIVVDMSSAIDPNTLKILDCSDWILFTTIVNIPAIRNCQRCLNLFRSRRYPKDKVKIIVNRYMENDEIKIEDIENTLGEKVYWKIPNNYFTIMEAINKGVNISEINPDSNIGNNFRDFASRVSDDIIEQSVIQYRI